MSLYQIRIEDINNNVVELEQYKKGFFNQKIKWNFTKFLVDQNGRVIKRYSPRVKPNKIAQDIERLLQKNNR